jgi:hypothetical protein
VLEPLVTGLKQKGFCFATIDQHPDYREWVKKYARPPAPALGGDALQSTIDAKAGKYEAEDDDSAALTRAELTTQAALPESAEPKRSEFNVVEPVNSLHAEPDTTVPEIKLLDISTEKK